jgi:hypothetical protein
MRTRPVSITVIGWLLLVAGFLTLPAGFAPSDDPQVQAILSRRPVPIAVQQGMLLAGAIANLVSGYFLLRGQNWARHLYMAWTIVQLGYAWLAAPFRLAIVPGAIFFLVVAVALFRPRANAFFAGDELVDVVSGGTTPRRVVGICFYIFAGFFLVCSSFGAFMRVELAEKSVTLLVMLLPAIGMLWLGRMASGREGSRRDFGSVLVASAVVSGLMSASIALMVFDPDFHKLVPMEHLDDYASGILWIAAMGGAGGVVLFRQRPGA